MDIELKPCPFCGGVAGLYKDTVEYDEVSNGLIAQFVVTCKKCGAQTPRVAKLIQLDIDGNPVVKLIGGGEEPQDLWNRRVEDANASNALEEDAISRKAAIEAIEDWYYSDDLRSSAELIRCLPSVIPQSKIAHVISDEDGNIKCSNCGSHDCWGNYCSECGAKMV